MQPPAWGDSWRVGALVGDDVLCRAAADALSERHQWSRVAAGGVRLRAEDVDSVLETSWAGGSSLVTFSGLGQADRRALDRLLLLTEQPPETVRVILLAASTAEIPATLLSRVEVMSFPVPTADLHGRLGDVVSQCAVAVFTLCPDMALLERCDQDPQFCGALLPLLQAAASGEEAVSAGPLSKDRDALEAARHVITVRLTRMLRNDDVSAAAAAADLEHVMSAVSLDQLTGRSY